MNEESIEIVYDHYKDTFTYIREYIKERERYFAFSLVILVLILFQVNNYSLSSELTLDVLKKNIPNAGKINFEYLDSILLFIFLSTIVKYIQLNLLIERQYPYLHKLEDELSKQIKTFQIEREGKLYLKEYPWVKSVIHKIYAIVYPILLLTVMILKLVNVFQVHGEEEVIFKIIDSILCGLIILISILYLIWTTTKDFKKFGKKKPATNKA